jgi:anti-sigma B factor antagonist
MSAVPGQIRAARAQGESKGNAIVREERDHAEVVHVLGEVDLSSADELSEAIAAAGASLRPVVVDLQRATYLDSTTLTALVRANAALAGRFYIVLPSGGIVRRVFEITSLIGALPIVESIDQIPGGA